jgi:membrane protease YdiL (CAAX protease family)
MSAASGFQIAFLIFAFQFLSMLVARYAASKLGWSADSFELLGQLITFGLAIATLVAIPPIRRYCQEELRRPLPPGAGREIAVITLAKAAIPFGIAGAVVLGAFASGEPGVLPSRLMTNDPVKAWQETFSSAGFVRSVLLAWLLGPIVEELVFRGLLYRAWERQWGWIPSLFLTSACFGLYHPTHIISASLGSVVFICILRRTGTLRASILVHIGFNVLLSWPLLGQLLTTIEGRDINRLSTWSAELASLVFVAVALPAYLALSRRDAREAVIR